MLHGKNGSLPTFSSTKPWNRYEQQYFIFTFASIAKLLFCQTRPLGERGWRRGQTSWYSFKRRFMRHRQEDQATAWLAPTITSTTFHLGSATIGVHSVGMPSDCFDWQGVRLVARMPWNYDVDAHVHAFQKACAVCYNRVDTSWEEFI